MATEVKVPTLGESISSGIIAAWHVKDGDYVEKDQAIFELETDKITSEGIADASGVIAIKAEEGEEVEIGQVVATIDESAEKPSGRESDDESETEEKEEADKKDEDSAEDERKEDDSKEKQEAQEEKETEDSSEDDEASEKESSSNEVSPAVRRIAEEEDLDPSKIDGSGKGGRVTKGDMLKALESRGKGSPQKGEETEKEKPSKESAKEEKGKPSGERQTRKRMTPLRRKIAERLVSAQQEAAMLTTFNEADLSAVKQLRAKYQDRFVEKHGLKLGFMSFFVKAVVNALIEVPGLNAMVEGDDIVQNHYYDIGIAVSTEKGLLVPVVRNCDQLSLAEIEKEIVNYAKKARDGKIALDDLQGGVFTITNGGIFGSMLSTPILNAPQSGILGMHTIQDRPAAVNGEVVIRPMMYLAVSYDHRIVDGKEAVTFLVKVKEAIEDPNRLILAV